MKITRPEDLSVFPEIRDLTPEEEAEACELARDAFTAADLQKYTEPCDDFIPVEDVMNELEQQQAKFDAKRNR